MYMCDHERQYTIRINVRILILPKHHRLEKLKIALIQTKLHNV